MKLLWCSDIHLDQFKTEAERLPFYQTLADTDGDAILLTGDIANAQIIEDVLDEMVRHTGKKIYFVAGNHDYYGSSIKDMRPAFKKFQHVRYLPKSWGVKLNRQTALVGQDGWGDCRNGDFENSTVILADWAYISELRLAQYLGNLKEALQEIADKDAERLTKAVIKATKDKNVKKIIIASHVPPVEEACLDAGRKSTPYGLPFFTSQIFGVSIIPVVESNPNIEFVWLCGHTHSRVKVEKRPNFTIQVAESEYGCPQIEEIINV